MLSQVGHLICQFNYFYINAFLLILITWSINQKPDTIKWYSFLIDILKWCKQFFQVGHFEDFNQNNQKLLSTKLATFYMHLPTSSQSDQSTFTVPYVDRFSKVGKTWCNILSVFVTFILMFPWHKLTLCQGYLLNFTFSKKKNSRNRINCSKNLKKVISTTESTYLLLNC